jgi:hypothetical protein
VKKVLAETRALKVELRRAGRYILWRTLTTIDPEKKESTN